MSIPASAFDPSRRLDLYFRIKRAGTKKFIFVNAAGAPIDISAFGFIWRLKEYAGARGNTIELTIGAGLTVGGAGNNELSSALTVANTSVSEGEYFHELIKGSTSKTYLNGKGIAHNGYFDGVASDTETITVTDGGDTVTITISDSMTVAQIMAAIQTASLAELQALADLLDPLLTGGGGGIPALTVFYDDGIEVLYDDATNVLYDSLI